MTGSSPGQQDRRVVDDSGDARKAKRLAKLADFLVAGGVVDDISHEGLRVLLFFGLCADRDAVPDLAVLAEGIEKELAALAGG